MIGLFWKLTPEQRGKGRRKERKITPENGEKEQKKKGKRRHN